MGDAPGRPSAAPPRRRLHQGHGHGRPIRRARGPGARPDDAGGARGRGRRGPSDGLRVAAHAEGLEGARLAIEAGVDTIEHGLSLHRAPGAPGPDGRSKGSCSSRRSRRSTTSRSASRPTSRRRSSPRPSGRAPRRARRSWPPARRGRRSWPWATTAVRRAPTPASWSGWSRPGSRPSEAIVAATAGSARALGLTDRGTIEPGQAADLLVVDGDPLADPAVLADPARIRLVARDGVPVAGTSWASATAK